MQITARCGSPDMAFLDLTRWVCWIWVIHWSCWRATRILAQRFLRVCGSNFGLQKSPFSFLDKHASGASWAPAERQLSASWAPAERQLSASSHFAWILHQHSLLIFFYCTRIYKKIIIKRRDLIRIPATWPKYPHGPLCEETDMPTKH